MLIKLKVKKKTKTTPEKINIFFLKFICLIIVIKKIKNNIALIKLDRSPVISIINKVKIKKKIPK